VQFKPLMTEIRQISSSCRLATLWMHEFEKENPALSRRETEKNGTLFLLKQLFPLHSPALHYTEKGKPYVSDYPGGISISHSHDLLAILADEEEKYTGLDVEQVRDKVLKIRHKFLSENEKQFIPEKNVIMHIMAWCAKETLYKIHSEGMLDFIGNLVLEPFAEDDTHIKGHCISPEIVFDKTLRIEKIQNYLVCYPVKQNQPAL
jgi:phosphopantetheinyl transferase